MNWSRKYVDWWNNSWFWELKKSYRRNDYSRSTLLNIIEIFVNGTWHTIYILRDFSIFELTDQYFKRTLNAFWTCRQRENITRGARTLYKETIINENNQIQNCIVWRKLVSIFTVSSQSRLMHLVLTARMSSRKALATLPFFNCTKKMNKKWFEKKRNKKKTKREIV